MKAKSTSPKANFSKIILYASVGFLLGLVSYFLIKIISIVIVASLLIGVVAYWQRKSYSK